jgi:hypothetical protein
MHFHACRHSFEKRRLGTQGAMNAQDAIALGNASYAEDDMDRACEVWLGAYAYGRYYRSASVYTHPDIYTILMHIQALL